MAGVGREVIVFAVAVLSGASVMLAYECLECFREIMKHSLVLIGIEDILYWIGTALYLSVQIYQTNSGRIRWHFILGVVLGVFLMLLFVKKTKKFWEFFRTKRVDKLQEKR